MRRQESGVIEMLEKLLDKFIDERTTLEKEEMNSKHAYDMLMQDLNAQIAQATQDRDEKAETKAKKLQAKADADGDLKDTTTTRDADVKYLAELTSMPKLRLASPYTCSRGPRSSTAACSPPLPHVSQMIPSRRLRR